MNDDPKSDLPPGSAMLLRFPQRAAAGSTVAPAEASERLARAVAGLLRANQDQAAAIAAWRASLRQLRHSLDGLAGSVARFQGALAEAAGRIDANRDLPRPGERIH